MICQTARHKQRLKKDKGEGIIIGAESKGQIFGHVQIHGTSISDLKPDIDEVKPDFKVVPLKHQMQFRCPGCGQPRPAEYNYPVKCPFCGTIIQTGE